MINVKTMSELVNYILAFSGQLGYGGILLLMTVESSFIPFPSEVVIPPAAYLASQGEFNIFLVVFYGIIGSLLGAIINYFLAFYLGRAIIYRLADHKVGHFLFLSSSQVKKAEDFFAKHGGLSTFIGRLVPVVRQLISMPAGFARMSLFKFIAFTALGSGLWTLVLAFLGYWFGSNKEALSNYYGAISNFFLITFLILIVVFLTKKIKKARDKKNVA